MNDRGNLVEEVLKDISNLMLPGNEPNM